MGIPNGTHMNGDSRLISSNEGYYLPFVFLGCLTRNDCFQLRTFALNFIILSQHLANSALCKYTTFLLPVHQLTDTEPRMG